MSYPIDLVSSAIKNIQTKELNMTVDDELRFEEEKSVTAVKKKSKMIKREIIVIILENNYGLPITNAIFKKEN